MVLVLPTAAHEMTLDLAIGRCNAGEGGMRRGGYSEKHGGTEAQAPPHPP
jgi:hypothetical protein